MSNQEPKVQPVELKEKDDQPGRFRSPLDDFPGYIQFPNPLMLHHVNAWWTRVVEPSENLKTHDLKRQTILWESYRDMLVDNDGWHIEGITVADVKANIVPQSVVSLVLMTGEAWILNHLSPKQRDVIRSIILPLK